MQFDKMCLSTHEHAPQMVLACAYARHALLSQSVCIPRPSSKDFRLALALSNKRMQALLTSRIGHFIVYHGVDY